MHHHVIKSFRWTQINALLLNDDSGLMVTICYSPDSQLGQASTAAQPNGSLICGKEHLINPSALQNILLPKKGGGWGINQYEALVSWKMDEGFKTNQK